MCVRNYMCKTIISRDRLDGFYTSRYWRLLPWSPFLQEFTSMHVYFHTSQIKTKQRQIMLFRLISIASWFDIATIEHQLSLILTNDLSFLLHVFVMSLSNATSYITTVSFWITQNVCDTLYVFISSWKISDFIFSYKTNALLQLSI